LYDFAPIGYFTLSKEGKIIELNLSGSKMLDEERKLLKNCYFGFFVSDSTKTVFITFLKDVFSSKCNQSCELTISPKASSTVFVHLTGIVASSVY